MGTITLSTRVRIEKNRAILSTGQEFPLEAEDAPEEWRRILFSEGTARLVP